MFFLLFSFEIILIYRFFCSIFFILFLIFQEMTFNEDLELKDNIVEKEKEEKTDEELNESKGKKKI